MSYSFLLRQARKDAGLSLREAAFRLQLSPSTLFRYEEDLILHIPPERLLAILRFYRIDPEKLRRRQLREAAAERLFLYEKSQRPVDADFLYACFSSLDERGQRAVLRLMLHESEVSAQLRLHGGPPPT